MMMSESKDNTLIRLITSSTTVSRQFSITVWKTQRRDGTLPTRSLVRSLARSLVRLLDHN